MSTEIDVAERTESAAPGFRYVVDWPTPSPYHAHRIRTFWRSEGALNDDVQIAERLPQVVLHACDANDRVAAVCTAVATIPPSLGEPLYYYRCFVGQAWRTSRLVMALLRRAQACLEAYARANGFPCIGIVLELENERFHACGRAPVWGRNGFVYVGRNAAGRELRAWYFRGARLRSDQAVDRLALRSLAPAVRGSGDR